MVTASFLATAVFALPDCREPARIPTGTSHPPAFARALIQRRQSPVSIATVAPLFPSKKGLGTFGVFTTSLRPMTFPCLPSALPFARGKLVLPNKAAA